MQAAEALNKICGKYTAVVVQTCFLNSANPVDTPDAAFEYVTDPNVLINVTGSNTTATLRFEDRESYTEFLDRLNQMAILDTPDGCEKANIITFSPWQDDVPGESVYATGFIGMYQFSPSMLAVQFIFEPGAFEVFSVDMTNLDVDNDYEPADDREEHSLSGRSYNEREDR